MIASQHKHKHKYKYKHNTTQTQNANRNIMAKKNICVARVVLPGSLRAAYFSSIFYVQDKNVPTKVLKV